LRRSITAAVALLALATVAGTALGADGVQGQQIQAAPQQKAQAIGSAARAYYGGEISRFQKQTWHWQRVMGAPLTPRLGRTVAELSPPAIQRAAGLWRRRSARAYKTAQHPPHLSELLCIHHHEGSWTDTGAPYYGGLQMDRSFQQSYGGWLYTRKGTADHWAPIEQIWVAEKALKSRGFWPWPNTARFCGLI
jgi:hypothetical protein